MIPYVLLVIYLASMVGCHYIAKARGADAFFWGFMAFLVGPLALPFVFFSRVRR
jgi:hypothetical protein